MRACLVVALSAAGYAPACVPFALPPSQLSVGGGPALGEPQRRRSSTAVTSVRAGLHPLGALRNSQQRAVDVGAGYQLDLIGDDEGGEAHGPYLELALYPVRIGVGRGAYLRGGARGTLDLLFRDSQSGGGGMVVAEIELTNQVSGSFLNSNDSGFVAGRAFGQWAVGLFAGGLARTFGNFRYAGLTAGVSVRIPLVVGVVCCAWPKDSLKARRKRAHRRARRKRSRD